MLHKRLAQGLVMTALSQCKVVSRNKLFYNKYKYKANFKMSGGRFTYYTDNLLDYHKRIIHAKTKQWHVNYEFDTIDFTNIDKFFKYKALYSDKISIRIESDNIGVFSNDLSILEKIDFNETIIDYSVINLSEPDEILFKKKPKYAYRTYFKNHRTSTSFLEDLLDFEMKTIDKKYDASISKALLKNIARGWIRNRRYLYGTFYIDYNQESFQTMLHMMFPGALGKTYKLVQKT